MQIRPSTPDFNPGNTGNNDIAGAMSVILDIHRKRVKVRKSKVRDVAKGLAEVAYSLGETNDIEEFTDEITENIFEALQKVEKNRKKQKRN